MERKRVEAAFEAHQQTDHSPGDLGHDRDAFIAGLVEQRQHVLPQIRRVVGLVEVDADGATRSPGEFLHPWPLVDREMGVVGGELEHAVARPGQGVGNAEQLVAFGMGAGHQFTRLRAVDRRA